MSLRLHPEHGVNPTISMCFYCKGEKGEIVLMGRAYRGKAPMQMVMDYDPCEKCREQFDRGILFIEVNRSPNQEGQPPLYENGPYPTRNYWVLTAEAARRLVGDSDTGDKIMHERKALIDPETAQQIGLYDAVPESE